MSDDLDALLKQSIAQPDAGFSRNVMSGVAGLRKRQAMTRALTELVVVALLLIGISFTDLGATMERIGNSITASQPLIAGLSALLLGWLVIHFFGQAEKTDT
jgi:hypothetical protein